MSNNDSTPHTATNRPMPLEFYRSGSFRSATEVAGAGEADSVVLYQRVVSRIGHEGETVPASVVIEGLDTGE